MKYYIILLRFPSYFTYIIQLLDIKVFQFYKYYYKRVIREVFSRLETEYIIIFFFRDLTNICSKTFTKFIVCYTFCKSSIQLIEVKKTFSKLRVYSALSRPKELELTLPVFPATPTTVCYSIQALEAFEIRIPEVFSSFSAC